MRRSAGISQIATEVRNASFHRWAFSAAAFFAGSRVADGWDMVDFVTSTRGPAGSVGEGKAFASSFSAAESSASASSGVNPPGPDCALLSPHATSKQMAASALSAHDGSRETFIGA
jgi:hypothetical protein